MSSLLPFQQTLIWFVVLVKEILHRFPGAYTFRLGTKLKIALKFLCEQSHVSCDVWIMCVPCGFLVGIFEVMSLRGSIVPLSR